LPAELTPIERARRALTLQSVDRPAVGGGFVTNARALERAAGRDSFWTDPEATLLAAYRRWQVDVIFHMELPERPPGAPAPPLITEPTYRSDFDATLDPDDFNRPEDVVHYVNSLPDPEVAGDAIDHRAEYAAWLKLVTVRQDAMPDILWVPGHQAGVVRFMWYMDFGFEPYFMALALHPEVVERLFAIEAARAHHRNRAIARCIRENDLLPVVYMGEDICDNRGPLARPEILRRHYFPHLEYAFQPLVEVGIRILWHVDGLAREIVPDLLAAGVGGFQGFQEELGMTLANYRALRSPGGDPLLLVGSVSAVETMPFGSPDDVRTDVERCIDTGQPDGGFVLMPSSSLGDDVSADSIDLMYAHARAYGSSLVL
jgi:hypothetical protein